jgi:penicillin-binding protein 1A
VVTGGTGRGADVPGHEAYGKTGTTDSQGDAWFVGATPQLATAVWFGNWRVVEGGAGFGGDSAAPVFRAFMTQALANQPNVPLPDPGPVCARAGQPVIETGGRANRTPVAPVTPAVPELPTVQNQTPTPTAPAASAPAAEPPGGPRQNNGNGQGAQ